jgi:hypothetical protein
MWLYITGDAGGHSSFPIAAAAGSEQQSVISLTAFAQSVTGTTTSLVIGITGLCFLVFTGFRSLWSLASLIFVAALSFTANRFLIFAAPLFGLGVGAMAFFLWLMVSQNPATFFATYRQQILFRLLRGQRRQRRGFDPFSLAWR